MKALKEKRVSLRSLFRRGLVILSLFALVFASCGDSGGDGGGGGGGGGGQTVVEKEKDYIKDIKILKHPSMYSCEGAAVDLTGLEVEITWVRNKVTSTQVITIKDMKDENLKLFKVNPPIARVATAGTAITAVVTAGYAAGTEAGYSIEYNTDANDVLCLVPAKTLYVPSVFALQNTGTTSFGINGKIAAVYEDQPIDTTGLEFHGFYGGATAAHIPASKGWINPTTGVVDPTNGDIPLLASIPADYGRDQLEFNWAATGTTTDVIEKYLPASSDPRAWYVKRDTTAVDPTRLYYRRFAPGQNAAGASAYLDSLVSVDNYFFVAKLDYDSGVGNLRKFFVDEDEAATTASTTKIDWLKEFTDADFKFTVWYYKGDNQAELSSSRQIGMKEYVKAMNTFDQAGIARAAYPTYYVEDYTPTTVNLVTFNDEGYVWSVRMNYYTPGMTISGATPFKAPTVGANLGVPPQPSYPNTVIVPLSEGIDVLTYQGYSLVRKSTTVPLVNPQVKVAAAQTGAKEALLYQLKNLYDVVWMYGHDGDSVSALVPYKADAPKWPLASSIPDLELTDPDVGLEVELTFAQPASMGSEVDEIPFLYDVVP